MKQFIAGLVLALAAGGTAMAEPAPARTSVDKCAAAYGALAQDQSSFGTSDTLMGERYFNFARINFDERLTQLARRAERGVTELKTATESERTELYMKLVDAETEGDMDVPAVRDLVRLSASCDLEFSFSPSLGG